MDLSLTDASVDLAISSDVLEHVPDAYRAHSEIRRVLRPGGSHVFTVPFLGGQAHDQIRTQAGPDGPEFLEEPEYHGDPLREEGSLVYRIFSLEMLVRLDEMGFQINVYSLHIPWYGIFGPGSLVFEAIRVR